MKILELLYKLKCSLDLAEIIIGTTICTSVFGRSPYWMPLKTSDLRQKINN